MINYNEARSLFLDYLTESSIREGLELAMMEEYTEEIKEIGWVFYYQSKKFVETGNYDFAVGGNAPVIVDSNTSCLHVTGTRRGTQYYIDLYMKYRNDISKFHKEK